MSFFAAAVRGFVVVFVMIGSLLGLSSVAGAQDAAPPSGVEPPCNTVDFGRVLLIVGGAGYTETLPIDIPAGLVEIPEAFSYDRYIGRELVEQTSEIWELEFIGADGSVIGVSEPSGDLPDFVEEGIWVGSLGTVELLEPAVGVRAHHRPDINFDGQPSSVHPSAISICVVTSVAVPPIVTTTVPATPSVPASEPTTSTTEACPLDDNGEPVDPDAPGCPTPSGPSTEPEPTTTTAPPVTEAPLAPPTSPELPVTGATTTVWLLTGAWLLAAGTTLMAFTRHTRQSL